MIVTGIGIFCGLVWFGYMLKGYWQAKQSSKVVKKEAPAFIQVAQIIFLVVAFVELAARFGIEWILVVLTIITGVCWSGYALFKFFRKKTRLGIISNFAKQTGSFFWVLFVVLLLRSFVAEPYRIPSGSLLPTLQIGDFILVNKYAYGLRWPITHKKFWGSGEPQIGDIMVFLWPVNPSMYFVKRVVGLPGDKIQYVDKTLYRNGKKIHQKFLSLQRVYEGRLSWPAIKNQELLNHVSHEIYLRPDVPARDMQEITVPEGHYFMMGDNRDGSFDSRGWGFVPEQNIIGRATRVLLSWDTYAEKMMDKIRWNRMGHKIS